MYRKLLFIFVLVGLASGAYAQIPNLEAVTTQGNTTTNKISVRGPNGFAFVSDPLNRTLKSHYLKGSPADPGVVRFECTSSAASAGWEFYNSDSGRTLLYVRQATGNVGIGTADPKARLAVNGEMLAKKVRVTPNNWSDFVFEPSYQLPSLQQVEHYIAMHKHLPDIPSAKEISENDLELGENQAKLLQKIEEMTLYLIAQEKALKEREQRIAERQQLLNERERRLSELEAKVGSK
ncbi:hypothetical protein [Chitinophaga filiformis]|uniref:Uncharacterized protein n=1 Tax=Chitinophaga filiformis TaxID=104663 RepID=A0A1G7NAH5_CHIFI|nr:hypothetical protein [Chitinophaga filiformis]SDF70907.1 hypothetical protein SAMN04488121_102724 [Chitinophaga filiformis]